MRAHDESNEGGAHLFEAEDEVDGPGVDRGLGHAGELAVDGSWAMTVPPVWAMARTPMLASLPVPVSTTPIVRPG